MIKRVLSIAALSLAAVLSFGQPKLCPDNIEEVIKAMTDEELASLLVGAKESEFEFFEGTAAGVRSIPRVGIPATISCDGPAGLHFYPFRDNSDDTFYCTAFPVGTLTASSWDPEMMEMMAAALGNEVHEYGVDMFLGPGMNIHRNPLCGRNFEYFSEDPVDGRRLRPGALMASYNKLNGEYVQQSYDLLTTILRDEWGYEGVVLTDHGAKDGTVKAAKAGCDLMQPGELVSGTYRLSSGI